MSAQGKIIYFGWILSSAVLLLATPLQASQIAGVTFAEALSLPEAELQLKGVAKLKWGLFFDIYAGALYLPKQQTETTWKAEIPKRLELSYFRKFSADEIVTASDHLLRKNLSAAKYQELAGRLDHFHSLYRDVRPGDRYSLTYLPQDGTELRINNQLLGTVTGSDFAEAYFGLWLGEKPISIAFRDQLLGRK